MINTENSTNLPADSLQAPQILIVWDSSQVRAIDNGTTCCYWSASLSNRLRALKAHGSLFKCCEKNCPNYIYWIQGNIAVLESGYFFDHLCHWNGFILLSLAIFNLFLYIFLIRGGGCHWQGTASGPKSHIGRSKNWHWQGRKVTQGPKCHLGVL